VHEDVGVDTMLAFLKFIDAILGKDLVDPLNSIQVVCATECCQDQLGAAFFLPLWERRLWGQQPFLVPHRPVSCQRSAQKQLLVWQVYIQMEKLSDLLIFFSRPVAVSPWILTLHPIPDLLTLLLKLLYQFE
jgi:hypothetical protein